MALVEKVEHEDLILYEILRNPVLCGEFIQNMDKLPREEKFEFSDYQKDILCDYNNNISIIAGRAAGKTVSLVNILTWLITYNVFPTDYVCYIVPSKANLEPVWSGLVRLLRTNSFLKHFISPNSGINSSDYKITLLNQAVLLCRIAGQSGTGISVIGLHTPFFVVDESGYFPWGTWLELLPTVNTFTPGFRLMVAGVPDGRREKSVCYHCDMENSDFSKYRIPSKRNPRFSEKDWERALQNYGGEESDDFIHLVLAQHGRPVFALFDRSTMEILDYPTYKLFFDGLQVGENLFEIANKLNIFPGVPNKKAKTLIGIDLGYTEPTAIIIMYSDDYGRLKFHGRIQLTKVSYPVQEKIIDILDSKFQPSIIGIDKGNAGMSLLQHMMEDKEYLHKDYKKRMIPVDFSSSIVLGLDTEGKEIKSKTKPFATSVLQDYSNNHKIIYTSTDLEMITELERMTYSKTPTGEIVYKTLTVRGGKKGEDHFTSALLCASLAYYLNNEFILNKPESKKLARPHWFI